MGSLLLKAKETQKLSADFQRDFEPCCVTPLDVSVPGEVGLKPILARSGPCPSAVVSPCCCQCVLFAGVWSWQADQVSRFGVLSTVS